MKMVEYLFRKVIPLFIGAIVFFSLVLILVDLMMNLWGYVSNSVPVAKVFQIMALYVPKTIWYAIPIAILFAVSYTLSDLYANNELIAIFASGISLFKFTFPLLIFGFLMSFFMFFFDDKVVVETYAKKLSEQGKALQKEKSLNNDKIVVLSDNGNIVYKAELYDDKEKRLNDVYIVIRNEDKSLNSVIRCDSAKWNGEHWNLVNGIKYTIDKDNETITAERVEPSLANRLSEVPETFQNNVVSVETVDSKTAKVYIDHLLKAGLPAAEQLSLYYKKFSFPFIVFIVVFLSIGLSGKTRKNVMLISLASCISSSVLFYVMQMITMLLAKFEYISPLAGAWFPVFIFIIIAAIVMRYART